jgi:cytochrome P450
VRHGGGDGRSFATVGGPLEIGAIIAAWISAYMARTERPAAYFLLAAAVLLTIAFVVVWIGFTNPVNARTAPWTVESMPPDWWRWRSWWEYSHLTRFFMRFVAFLGLLFIGLRSR